MSINTSDKPEVNVVNVGDEISSDELAAITGAADPTSENPFATMADVGGGDFLPLAGGTMTGDILFGTASQYIGEGNFDTDRGGVNGISLVCSVGYEFNWQAGWLTTTEQNSTTPRSLYLDGQAGTTLRVWNNTSDSGTHLSTTDLIFGTTVDESETWSNTTINNNGIAWTDFEAYQAGGYNKLGFELWFNGANNATLITASLDSAGSNNPNIQLQPDYGASAGAWVPMKIDGFGLTFPDGSYQTSATFGTGDQTLNTTDVVNFAELNIEDVANYGAGVVTNIIPNGLTMTNGDYSIYLNPNGDGMSVSDTTGTAITSYYGATGVTFPDSTTQTSAPVVSTATVLTGGTADLSSDDYPDEVRISIGGVIYAMPARIIT
jgi:hypothetical protein